MYFLFFMILFLHRIPFRHATCDYPSRFCYSIVYCLVICPFPIQCYSQIFILLASYDFFVAFLQLSDFLHLLQYIDTSFFGYLLLFLMFSYISHVLLLISLPCTQYLPYYLLLFAITWSSANGSVYRYYSFYPHSMVFICIRS